MIYLDTSAFIKLYFHEEESIEVGEFVANQNNQLPIWELLEAEVLNAFQLKVFRKELDAKKADGLRFLFRQHTQEGCFTVPNVDRPGLMDTFLRLSLHTPKLGCRAMDIFHVAFALQIQVDIFASYDVRQRALAQESGLQVFPEKLD